MSKEMILNQELAHVELDIEQITEEILEAKRVGGRAVMTIGRKLVQAKGLLKHGEWLPWLNEKVEFSERSAQNFMRLYENYSKSEIIADLGATKALTLLALPESERDDFIAQTHEVGGEEKTVVDMTTRELERAIRERDEARAEHTRTLADLASYKATARDANSRYNTVKEERDRIRKELDELKARPVEVAVQEDEEAKRRITELEEQLERAQAEKPSPFAGDDSLIQFNMLFDQAQETVNKMRGLLLKVRGSDADAAERLGKALEALAELVKGAAA